MLLLIAGLPGSGKTTLARAYAERYGALHLNSDLLRRELDLMGHYRPEEKKRVYDELLRRTGENLRAGREVVVDGTFYREAVREPFRRLAADCDRPLRWVEVRADEAAIRARLRLPRTDSEADFAVYEKVRAEFEPLAEPHLIVWSDRTSLEAMTEEVRSYTAVPPPA